MRWGLLILIVFFASCSTSRWCEKHCVLKTVDSSRVEVHDSVVIKEVLIPVPADTVRDSIKVPCKDFEYKNETAKQKIYIKVHDGNLAYENICKEQQLKATREEHWHTIKESSYHMEIQKGQAKVNKTMWTWLSYWQSWACLGIILFFVVTAMVRKLKKLGYKIGFTLSFPFITITK